MNNCNEVIRHYKKTKFMCIIFYIDVCASVMNTMLFEETENWHKVFLEAQWEGDAWKTKLRDNEIRKIVRDCDLHSSAIEYGLMATYYGNEPSCSQQKRRT
jgi:hypothetical protein